MYRFSRAIYREIASDIIEVDHANANHERVLRTIEATIERMATDRHYFARPARTLFKDIRAYFPMNAQLRVLHVVERYLAYADEFIRAQPQNGYDLAGNPAAVPRQHPGRGRPVSGCRYRTTATALPISTWPRPKRSSSATGSPRSSFLEGADAPRFFARSPARWGRP